MSVNNKAGTEYRKPDKLKKVVREIRSEVLNIIYKNTAVEKDQNATTTQKDTDQNVNGLTKSKFPKRTYVCKVCQFDCITRTIFRKHYKLHFNLKTSGVNSVDISNPVYGVPENLDSFIILNPRAKPERWKCKSCSCRFSSKRGFRKHRAKHELGITEVIVPEHRSKESSNANKCTIVDKNVLIISDQTSAVNKIYPCKICSEECLTHSGYKLHYKTTHKNVALKRQLSSSGTAALNPKNAAILDNVNTEIAHNTKKEGAVDQKVNKTYSCSTCLKKFASRGSVKQHRKKAHPLLKIADQSTNEKITDNKSKDLLPLNKQASSESLKDANLNADKEMLQNANTEDKTYLCSICSKEFRTRIICKRHRKKAHFTLKPPAQPTNDDTGNDATEGKQQLGISSPVVSVTEDLGSKKSSVANDDVVSKIHV